MASTALPQRPYLMRAMHAWIIDSGHTPHVVVNADAEGVSVPAQFVRDGKIVLNISHEAVTQLEIGNELLTFNARFSGTAMFVRVPVAAVLGIYARETGRGMIFPEEESDAPQPDEPPPAPPAPAGKARLKVVK
ncbi:MAG: ClpXP protease specificity-enhancing factor [Gammaproteobacteria bacterium]|nr:ClpXP protease specificity-enhancing factor [Gammaproteobacteria bacterium]